MFRFSYAAPGTSIVTQQFKLDFATYMASSENVIMAFVDGRGSGSRGDNNVYDVYKQLGTHEVQDQLTAIRYGTKNGTSLRKYMYFVIFLCIFVLLSQLHISFLS